ncbi:hypothetical protein KY308_04160 [Candidatus Woesearchaeota archaeon]|nr:hypothetical protein [Candidatus Woesearchaeota archaeon]
MKRILLVSLLVAVFLVGCTLPGRTTDQTDSGVAHSGTQGIEVNFLTNYPPSIIYSPGSGDTGNSIVLEIKNKGAFTTGANFYLSGYDKNIVNIGSDTQVLGTIEGKTPTNTEGGYTQMQFPSYGTFSVNLPQGSDLYPFTLQATACYDYKTQASLPVCIDPDPYGLIKQKACTPHGAATGGGQGGPVAITSVVQESLPGKVVFKLKVGNMGGGQVIEKGRSNVCTTSTLRYDMLDKLDYTIRLGGTGATSATGIGCKPVSPIRLVNGQGTINCEFNLGVSKLAYTTTLDVELNYGYMKSVQKAIQIKRI